MAGTTSRYRGKVHSYYECANHKRTKECDQKPIRKDLLEDIVIQKINDTIFSERNVDAICRRIHTSYQQPNAAEGLRAKKSEIERINGKIHNLYKAIENGLDIEETTKRINAWKAEKDKLQIAVWEMESMPSAPRKTVEELKMDFRMTSDIRKLRPEEQRAVIQRFVSRITACDTAEGVGVRIFVNPDDKNLSDLLDIDGGEGGI